MASPERHLRYEDLEGRRMMSTVTPAAIDLERDSAQYLSIPDANQRGLDLQGDFTVECRFRLESAPGTDEYRPLLSKWTGGASAGRAYTFVYINLGGTPKICVNLSADGTNVTSKTIDYTFQPGTWYDIAFSFKASSGTVDVYVDGEQIGSMTGFPTTIKDSAADAALGNFLGETFDGQIDEMRVWAVTRSGEEIAANRRMDLQGDEAGLVSDWRFNDNVLTDAALSGNTFVNRGGAVFSSDVLTVQQRVQETTAAVDAVMGEGNNPEGDPEHVILSPSKGDMLTPSSVQEQQNIEARGSTELTMTQACLDASESPETPITPTIRIAEIAGNTVLVSLASPEDASTVVIGGCGGILQQETLSHAGGTELAMAKVTLNKVTPPGRYPLALFGPSSSQAITSIEVDWNGQTLSLASSENQWDALSQAEQTTQRGLTGIARLKTDISTAQAAVTVFGKQMALTSTNLDGFPSLKRLQINDLFERCDPKWKLEMNEIPALVRERHPTADAATVRGTSDALCGQLDSFSIAVGEILFAAVEVYRQVEHGGDQDRLLENLRTTIAQVNLRRAVIEIRGDTGRTTPTYEEALEEGLRLYNAESTLNVLAYRQAEQDRLRAIDRRIADNPDYQKEFLGQAEADTVLYASASNGYAGYLDESQMRRLERIAGHTETVLALATNAHARLVLAVAGQYNAQREYAIAMANGTSTGTTVATTLPSDVSQPPASGTFTREGLLALGEWVTEVGGIQQEAVRRETVQNAIKERVTARLNERLQSMTPEERANARGLLRLQEDGRLDEYFISLFSGDTPSEVVNAEVGEEGQYSVYYLLDSNVLAGAGHAAMIMGSDAEGWYYFSFGVGATDQGSGRYFTASGNMDVNYYSSLNEAHTALSRYGYFLHWDVADASSIRSAFKEASGHLVTNYNFFAENCDDIASKIIRAAGIELDDRWMPVYTYLDEMDFADGIGMWNGTSQ
ncbi:MAG: LamG domain-containing protein [Candidatus Peribacteraceae bacterium]|nr:LamG domain-containing protein [Candidatus Peribacteraceae bacterium]